MVVALLTLLYVCSFLDRQIISILAEPIKAELSLSDTQIGLLSGFMFALFYTTFGIPLAWLADRANRVWIIAMSCAMWSMFTALCGSAGNFVHLALARIGVGIGEAGGVPPSVSIISDYFPPARRGFALSLFLMGAPAGAAIGAALGGYAAAQWGWRTAFVIVGAPGVVLALLILLLVREPPRGRFDPQAQVGPERESLWRALREFFQSPTLSWVAVSSGLAAFMSYGIVSWLPAFLMRGKGMAMEEVALYYSLASGLSFAVGLALGGLVVDRFGRHDKRIYLLVPAVGLVLAAPLFVIATLAPDWRVSLLLMTAPCALSVLYSAPTHAIVQNLVAPARRSVSSAIVLLVLNLVGLGGGPLAIGMISDWATPRYGDDALGVAFLAVTPVFVLAALAYYMTSRTLSPAAEARASDGR